MFPFPNVAIPKTRMAECVSACQSSESTVWFKDDFVYVPDGEMELYASKNCLFGLINYAAEARTYVVGTTQSHSKNIKKKKKVLLGVGLEYLGYKMC